jgi:anaerobic selenocysteine-containing dehydrogenase
LKRQSDGSFTEIGLEQALDEIADKLRPYFENARDAIGLYTGNGAITCSSANDMHFSFMASLGLKAHYTTVTIDQSAKIVSFERLGGWPAGRQGLYQSDVVLMFGSNPLVSHACLGCVSSDPTRRLKATSERGLQLILVDPRRTETSRYASLMLQPIPGQDAAIAAAMIRIIIDEGWGDADFTKRFATPEGEAALRRAVDPFTEDYTTRRAGLEPGQIRAASQMFACDNKRGSAFSATGPSMAPFSNLSQHLIDCLNVICGRFRRTGDKFPADMLSPEYVVSEEAISPPRSWQSLPPGRIRGVGALGKERLTGTLPEEILTPGNGQIRCLLVGGGNPVTAVPDTRRMVQALKSLDLLVVIDPMMSATAKFAHYILPPKMQFERADLPMSVEGFALFPDSWAQYTPAVIKPPPGSEVCDDWYPFWAIAKRLGVAISYLGKGVLPLDKTPTTEDLLELRTKGGRVSLEELKKYPSGKVWDRDSWTVQPGRPEATGRFDLMPADVAEEMRQLLASSVQAGDIRSHDQRFTHLLSCRRMPYAFCSVGAHLQSTRKRMPYNPAFLHPRDLQDLGAAAGDTIRITSDHGSIYAIVEPDEAVRPGVVSLSHGWGGGPAAPGEDWDGAANVNFLVACDRDVEAINGMPRMSAIPVNLERVASVMTPAENMPRDQLG